MLDAIVLHAGRFQADIQNPSEMGMEWQMDGYAEKWQTS